MKIFRDLLISAAGSAVILLLDKMGAFEYLFGASILSAAGLLLGRPVPTWGALLLTCATLLLGLWLGSKLLRPAPVASRTESEEQSAKKLEFQQESLTFATAPSRARRLVRDGDVIVSTVRTYLRAIAPINDPEPNLVVSTGFAVVRPANDLTTDYAAYALRAPYFVERVVANSKGVSFPAINESEMATYELAEPPEPEQRAIAAFLDRETARIDALVAKKERLIELLQEKRTALITRAVTKGLDPNVPMKDSGLEWLGEIPAHWEVEENRWLFRESDVRSKLGEEELLTVSHITGVTRRSEKPDVTMIEAESHEGYKICDTGELAINTMWAWMGALGIALEHGMVSPSYNVYHIAHGGLVPGYYDLRVPNPAARR